MSFDAMRYASVWAAPPVLPVEAYTSAMDGNELSREKHEELARVAASLQLPDFGEMHDVYLYTDMALAD
eukprot:6133707-Alexandrium_andersonii.AAC.1